MDKAVRMAPAVAQGSLGSTHSSPVHPWPLPHRRLATISFGAEAVQRSSNAGRVEKTAAEASPPVRLPQLPLVLMSEVLSYVDVGVLARLRQCNRRLGVLVLDAAASLTMDLSTLQSPPGLSRLLHRFTALGSVNLSGCKDLQPHDWKVLLESTRAESGCSLRHLQLRGVNLRMDRFLNGEKDSDVVVSSVFSKLKSLVLSGVLMLDAPQIQALLGSVALEEVTLDGLSCFEGHSMFSRVVQPLGMLRALHLPNAGGLPALNLRSSTLEVLELRGCGSLSEIKLDLPSLLCLDLSYTAVTGEVVEEVVQTCAHLRSLFLQGCRRIEAVCVISSSLTVFDASTCSSMRRLRVVGEQIHLLQLDLCVALEGLILDVPVVRQLDLSLLPMNQLQINASKLKRLNLNGCSLLAHIEADCPRLDSLLVACSPAPVEAFDLGDREACIVHGRR